MRVKFLLHGHVQGVGFRYYAQTKAAEHSMKGWARNLESGSVEIAAEGETRQVEAFMEEMKKGSPLAVVEEFEQSEYEGKEQLKAFKIK
ncbi:acylphosphatase [Bacillus mangrovi]|uniref:Acylphosphatase n=1 Tax=Metabacillus mangrovi TaxID=1491830 RepID=A0A7X2S6B4_9BACI|nr:acylphosphatase [Metabacillus mangrovi]MTH53586.1 acylphosphatase [Metabacillus mangrovi]